MSTVAVVMGVRNGAMHVTSAVRSVLGQSFADLEMLVMDDGSTDGTPDILVDLARADRRLKVFHQPNQGLGASLNSLIARSTAPFIARLDADDISLPRRIENQVQYLRANQRVAMVGTWSAFHEESSGIRACQTFPDRSAWLASQLYRGRNVFVHSSVMLRRAAIERLEGPYRFRLVQDFDLWLRIAEAFGVGMVEEVGVVSRWHAGRVSGRGYAARRRLHEAILELHRERERYGVERSSVEEIERSTQDAMDPGSIADIGPQWYEAMLALYERDYPAARRRFADVASSGGPLAHKAARWAGILSLPLVRHWLPALYSPLRYMVPPRAAGDPTFWEDVHLWLEQMGFATDGRSGGGVE